MKPTPLVDPFRPRMALLAFLAAILVGAVLPAVYSNRLLAQRQSEAQLWAQQVAQRISVSTTVRPRLWPYDTRGLKAFSAAVTSAPIRGRVCLDTPRRNGVFCLGERRTEPIVGWAVITVGDRVVGRVSVQLDSQELAGMTLAAWMGAGSLGLILGLALFFLPTGTVRRADERNEELWQTILDANAQLEGRVAERTKALARSERQLRKLSARLVAAQEDERSRISRDLHDDLGQVLTGLRLRLTTAQALLHGDPAATPHLEAALDAVDAGVERVRRLAHGLRPVALDSLGLTDALDGLILDWREATDVEVETDWAEDEPAGPDAEVLFRVTQEALTNVSRHAQATRVRVLTRSSAEAWSVSIEDDGLGLSTASGDGVGLIGLRERLAERGGLLTMDESPLGGVLLQASIPRSGEN